MSSIDMGDIVMGINGFFFSRCSGGYNGKHIRAAYIRWRLLHNTATHNGRWGIRGLDEMAFLGVTSLHHDASIIRVAIVIIVCSVGIVVIVFLALDFECYTLFNLFIKVNMFPLSCSG